MSFPVWVYPRSSVKIRGRNLSRGSRGNCLSLLHFFCRQVRLEAAAATRFVNSSRSHHYQVLIRNPALYVLGGIAALQADAKPLADFLAPDDQPHHTLYEPACETPATAAN